jgi:NAD(P)-dependent dehydrogenase (short-subunit alcohol dehydrogenase family)
MDDLGRIIILVTGATGTVGSEVVKQLVSSLSSSSSPSDQSIIRVAVHSQTNAYKFRQYGETVEIVNMDYNKPETIVAALKKVGKLFYFRLKHFCFVTFFYGLVFFLLLIKVFAEEWVLHSTLNAN